MHSLTLIKLATAILYLTPVVAVGSVRYVDDDNCPGPGSGTMVDPFCRIQAGIDAAIAGDEILVAVGTYNEIINFNGKAIVLRSSDGPEVTTIDATGLNDTVVRCVSGEGPDTIFQGFTVTGGLGDVKGGGMIIQESSPTIRDCVFRNNTLFPNFTMNCAGGGMYIAGGSPTVTNCQFINNSTGDLGQCGGTGGGMANFGSTPSVTGCTFYLNQTLSAGAGMSNIGSNPMVTNCTFIENQAPFGGGMYNSSNSSPTVTNCIFKNNVAGIGGGMDNESSSNPAVYNCIFSGNTASRGGGMHNVGGSNPLVTNCVFVGNAVTSSDMWAGGGGIYNNFSSSPTVTNCIFSGNTAGATGGAIFNFQGSSPVFINCSFTGNAAGESGSVMYNISTSTCTCTNSPLMNNCILWGNSLEQVFDADNAVTTITFSDVLGGFAGMGNIDVDPFFVDADGPDNIVGTLDDNLRLHSGSPAIDAADNTAVPPDGADLDGDGDTTERTPLDLDGNPRFIDHPTTIDSGNGTPPIVDMGAYEFQLCGNGVIDIGEECDDGFTDACGTCNADCTRPGTGSTCGDDQLCPEFEECDDGNLDDGDFCTGQCLIEGACCDRLDGFCLDGIPQSDCTGAQPLWTKEATCLEVLCDPALGACCNIRFGTCTNNVVLADCQSENLSWTKLEFCNEQNCPDPFIPTVSEWGLLIMTLLLLITTKIYFGRRRLARI